MIFAPRVPEVYVTELTQIYVDLLGFSVPYARPDEGFAF